MNLIKFINANIEAFG